MKEEEIIDYKDKYIRLLADFDNYKKNTAKRLENIKSETENGIILTLLPLLDDIERSINFMDSEGREIVNKMFDIKIGELGLEKYGEKHDSFDTDRHNAIRMVRTGCFDSGSLVDVVKRGYKYNGKIIRYADVVVEE